MITALALPFALLALLYIAVVWIRAKRPPILSMDRLNSAPGLNSGNVAELRKKLEKLGWYIL